MVNITKRFPGIIANDNVTLQLKKGEIHALLGENGAGKSTLMSVLFGLYQAEEGVIKKDGVEVKINNPNDANALGIGMVHQHFKLVECFSVLDNIILGVEPNKAGFLQKKQAREKVVALSQRYGLRVDPDAKVEDISVGMQQRTEILKALYHGAELLILDEPTSGLDPVSRDDLLDLLRSLCEQDGVSILFSTHITSDLDACADDVTYLQNGTVAQSVSLAGFTAPWKKLTGPETALAPALRGALRGLRVHRGEFEALYPSDLPCPAGCREELADLQTVMVYLEREVETV